MAARGASFLLVDDEKETVGRGCGHGALVAGFAARLNRDVP